MEPEQIKQNIANRHVWTRLMYMLVFYLILWPVSVILCVISVLQILFTLFTGKPNPHLLPFAQDLITYFKQILLFLTYSDEGRPFPFAVWGELEYPDDDTRQDK